jgi:hypothetical protein
MYFGPTQAGVEGGLKMANWAYLPTLASARGRGTPAEELRAGKGQGRRLEPSRWRPAVGNAGPCVAVSQWNLIKYRVVQIRPLGATSQVSNLNGVMH